MQEELPVHPFTGLTAIGVLPSGRIVWPILGGSGDDDDQDDSQQDDDTGQDDGQDDQDDSGQDDDGDADADQDDKPLGPKGQKAYEATKAKLKAERARRQAAEAKLAEKDKPADDKPDLEQAAMARVNRRVLRADIKAAATGKLADPTDALSLLNLDQFEADTDGEFDQDEIAEAIDDLITRKPHLAATQGGGKRFQGGGDGGARKAATKPITDEQLKAMTPTQIEKAYSEGKLAHLL
jgi:hypothetical protein